MNPPRYSITLTLPDAVANAIDAQALYSTPETRMAAAIALSSANIKIGGGPFGAAVFDLDSGRLVAPGANRVVPGHCSVAHAEMMAIMLAQHFLATHDFSEKGRFVLTTSAEPCCQCFGALPWTGLHLLEFGATRDDVEAIGFNEGPKPSSWIEALAPHGISVHGPILRNSAISVLTDYANLGRPIY